MNKILKSFILGLFLITNAHSGDIGEGEFKMEDFLIDYFHQYITIKGGKSPETFVVATDGSYAMYWYCPTGSCRAGGDNVKIRQCEIKAGTACKTFARGKTIKWKNGINPGRGKVSRVSSKWSKEELVAKLTELGFVGETNLSTTNSSENNKKDETKDILGKKYELKGKRSIALSWDGYSDLIAGVINFDEENYKGTLNLSLPNYDGTCEGTYSLQADGKGTWQIGCTNKMGAAGTLKWGDGGVTGSGRDHNDKKVKFTVAKQS